MPVVEFQALLKMFDQLQLMSEYEFDTNLMHVVRGILRQSSQNLDLWPHVPSLVRMLKFFTLRFLSYETIPRSHCV